MFGHDDNQMTQDTAPQSAPADGAMGASTMDVTTVGADDQTNAGFSTGTFAATGEPAAVAPAGTTLPAPAATADDATASAGSDDLLSIKQQALQQLSPLVGHLDQTPEEKFRTTMMMIQASDNQALIKDAYAAAQAIEDEKNRAQALLDIINEINYFTQHSQQA